MSGEQSRNILHSHLVADLAAGLLNVLASKVPDVGDDPAHAPLSIPAAEPCHEVPHAR